MKTQDMLPFRGLLANDIPLNDGRTLSVLVWDSTPTKIGAFTQLWITEPNGKRRCCIDPEDARGIFNTYHRFDELVAEKIATRWETPETLLLEIERLGIRLTLKTKGSFVLGLINGLLKTFMASVFARKGRTETGKAFLNQPHRIRQLDSVVFCERSRPEAQLRSKKQCFLVHCTHYLEA